MLFFYDFRMFHLSNGSASSPEALADNQIPRFVIQLRLKTGLPGSDDRYAKLMDKLAGKSWRKVERAVHKLPNTQLFVHTENPNVGFGVELTSKCVWQQFVLVYCVSI